MNEPLTPEKLGENNTEKPSKLRTIANTSKDLFREFAIKSTKSLINVGGEVFIKPETMSKYLKKMKFSDAIIAAAMKQAGFATDDVATKEVV